MNRRGFLGKISLGAAAIVAAPLAARLIDWDAIPAPPPTPKPFPGSIRWYTGYDSYSPPTSAEVLDAAEFQWQQLGGFVSVSELDSRLAPMVRKTETRMMKAFREWERDIVAALPQTQELSYG